MRRTGAFLAMLAPLVLGACAGQFSHLGKPPPMSPIVSPASPIDPSALARPVTPTTVRATPTAAPTPPRPVVVGQHRPGAASLFRSDTRSLFDDRRARNVGDIVTVLIDVDDEASVTNNTTRTRTGSERIGVTALLGLPSIADTILPGAGTLDPAIETDAASSSAGDGETTRNEEIQLEIAATVVDVLANGHLVVTGSQEIRVNFELRDLQVAGVVRPEDITRRNTITVDKIANARISYGGRGTITDLQQPRYGQQILDVVSPL